MTAILEFPQVTTAPSLSSLIREYKHALETVDLTSRVQVEQELQPLYQAVLDRVECRRYSEKTQVHIRNECVALFKNAHEQQKRQGGPQPTPDPISLEEYVHTDPPYRGAA